MLKTLRLILLAGAVLQAFALGAAGQTKKAVQQKTATIEKEKSGESQKNEISAVRLPGPNDQPLARGLQILKQANAAHGGIALDNLKTLRLTGRMRVNSEFYDYKILIDAALNRVREETRGENDYFYVSQAEGESGWVFAADQKREIEEYERRNLHRILSTGWLGLRSDALENIKLFVVEVDPTRKSATLRGETGGETYSRIFNRENLLISESLMYQPEENLDLYDDFRSIGVIKIPHRKTSLLKSLLLIVDWSAIEVNPNLTAKDWAIPQ